MIRPLASSFASLAMAVVVMRGVFERAMVYQVMGDALIAGLAFFLLGGVSGWILDYVIRDQVRGRFENRLRWYQRSIGQTGHVEANDAGQISAP